MSTVMKKLTRRENACLKSFICVAMTVIVIAAGLFSTGMITYAGEVDGSAAAGADVATPTELQQLSDGYIYCLGSDGERVSKSGWYSCTDSLMYLLDSNYRVVGKYERTGDVIKIYKCDGKSLDWQLYKNIWQSINGSWYYVDGSGVCKTLYDVKNNKIYTFGNNKLDLAKWQMVTLNDGGLYLTDGNGGKISKAGWNTVSGSLEMYTDGAGKVSMKLCVENGLYKLYRYDSSSKKWNLCKNLWIDKEDKYYFNSDGICTTIYFSNSRKAKLLSSSKKYEWLTNNVTVLSDGKPYYFNNNGECVTKSGWYSASGNVEYYVGGSGYVSARVYKKGSVYKMDTFSNNSWMPVRNVWRQTGTRLIYFSSTGNASTIYYTATRQLFSYSSKNNRYEKLKKGLSKLNSTRYYYYNSKGVRDTKTGWKRVSSKLSYYVGKGGYMTAKYTDKGGVRRYYSYSYAKKKWTLNKKLWKQVGNSKFYFGSNGNATFQYSVKTKKAYTYSNKKWKLVKKAIKKVGKTNYYFNSKGVRVTKAGTYKTSDGYVAYVNSKGKVYKKAYDLSVKRYYSIDIGHGKTAKVYGYYSIKAGKKLMKLVNQYRQSNGVAALEISTSMTETASTRAKEISYRYDHYRPNGTLCKKSMYELDGENLACGFKDSDSVFRAWTKSSGHDYNMLNPEYKTLGAAVFVALKNDKVGYKTYYVLTFGK